MSEFLKGVTDCAIIIVFSLFAYLVYGEMITVGYTGKVPVFHLTFVIVAVFWFFLLTIGKVERGILYQSTNEQIEDKIMGKKE